MHEDLLAVFDAIFDQGEAPGMIRPRIVCAVSPNGSTCVMRLHGEGVAVDPLAEHYEPAGLVLPMTIVVVDQRNEAAKLVLDAKGLTSH
jgi:hypothetical protein